MPVLQISLSSQTLGEQELYDYGIYRLRQLLAPIHGVTLPTPAGGKYRQIMVDINPDKLLAKGLTPLDVVQRGGVEHKGGVLRYKPFLPARCPPLEKELRNDVFLSTMIDLYALPRNFAGNAPRTCRSITNLHL